MKKLIFLAIHRRGLMFVLFAFIAVVGYYSWTRLAIDAYPDIADTTVQIVTQVAVSGCFEEMEQHIHYSVLYLWLIIARFSYHLKVTII